MSAHARKRERCIRPSAHGRSLLSAACLVLLFALFSVVVNARERRIGPRAWTQHSVFYCRLVFAVHLRELASPRVLYSPACADGRSLLSVAWLPRFCCSLYLPPFTSTNVVFSHAHGRNDTLLSAAALFLTRRPSP